MGGDSAERIVGEGYGALRKEEAKKFVSPELGAPLDRLACPPCWRRSGALWRHAVKSCCALAPLSARAVCLAIGAAAGAIVAARIVITSLPQMVGAVG